MIESLIYEEGYRFIIKNLLNEWAMGTKCHKFTCLIANDAYFDPVQIHPAGLQKKHFESSQ